MATREDPITIHTKKFYRVILEGIDTGVETPDSFAVKLSSRLNVPIARAKLVARCLPYTAKSGLNAAQANRLKTVLDEIGGKARVEPHFVTPPEPNDRETRSSRPADRSAATLVCPACGSEQPKDAKFCAFCLRKFRDPQSRIDSLADRLPEENPLEFVPREPGLDWIAALRFVRERPVPLLIGAIVVLLIVVLLK
jgi:hypothetical protein